VNETPIPAGFEQHHSLTGFMELLGPVYVKTAGKQAIVALRIEKKHLNKGGIAHGGLLATLTDSAMGINLTRHQEAPKPMVSVNLTNDYLLPTRLGDWVEAHVTVEKLGASLGFARCNLMVGERCVVRAHGIFALLQPR